jgi:hypothetical protein
MFIRIKCHNCGGNWKIYERDNWKDNKFRICPHCYSEIDSQTWKNQILPAWGFYMDANRELIKDIGLGNKLFTIDFKNR